MSELTLKVNGQDHKVTVDDPDTPLLCVLRDDVAGMGREGRIEGGARGVRVVPWVRTLTLGASHLDLSREARERCTIAL